MKYEMQFNIKMYACSYDRIKQHYTFDIFNKAENPSSL